MARRGARIGIIVGLCAATALAACDGRPPSTTPGLDAAPLDDASVEDARAEDAGPANMVIRDASAMEDAGAPDDAGAIDAGRPDDDAGTVEDAGRCEDRDGDGYGEGCALGPDCDDDDAAISPSAAERCDGARDDDCDGATDEGCACTNGSTRACGTDVGACGAGTQACASGAWGACTGAIGPSAEVCEGWIDEDCDGMTDEECPLTCAPSERECAGACRACPTTGVATTTCSGAACVAASCTSGYVVCGAACCPAGPTWSAPETITTTVAGTYLLHPSIVVEPGGAQHVTYFYSGLERVSFYGRRTGPDGAWTISDPEYTTARDAFPALAVDPSGTAHVVYLNEDALALRYARGSSSGWAFRAEHVHSSSHVAYPSLALDSTGRLHVVQRFGVSSYLSRHARSPSSPTWAVDTVGAGILGELPSIAMDSSDGAHVVFCDASTSRLMYAYQAAGGSSWAVSTIDARTGGVDGPSLAVGADGALHVAYAYADQLWYARRAPGATSWTTARVDDRYIGRWPSIGVDRAGVVHIAYPDRGASQLRHATNRGGAWRTSMLDASGYTEGGPRSLFVDALDRVHVVYFDAARRALRYLVAS